MQIKNQDRWEKFIDENTVRGADGSTISRHLPDLVEGWANGMEGAMASGVPLAEAMHTEFPADLANPPSFEAAISILAQCWEHGDELLRLHNGSGS